MFCARHFFCSQVLKTTSNVLNSDVNIVSYSTRAHGIIVKYTIMVN